MRHKLDLNRNRQKISSKDGEGDGTPLQYSCLENPMDRGAWWAAIYGVAQSRTRLSDFTFTFHFHALEKEMATHSSVLSWRIPGMGEPGGLPSVGLYRVGHDWSDLAAAAARNPACKACVSYTIWWWVRWWKEAGIKRFEISTGREEGKIEKETKRLWIWRGKRKKVDF